MRFRQNCQISINNTKLFKTDLTTPYQFHEELCSLFNMGGGDKNSGPLLSYTNFLHANRWYGFDLKRQAIFETDSKVSQQIKFQAQFVNAATRVVY